MTQRIAHLADLHFGTVPGGAAEALASDLHAQEPDAVVVTGDLTQRARPEEFAAARRFFDGLAMPVLAIPGNHDIPAGDLFERLGDPFGRWRAHFRANTEGAITLSDTLIVGLNSARRMALHLDWSAGRLSRRQIARLGSVCSDPRCSRIVLALHHPPFHPDWAAHRRPLGRAARLRAALGRNRIVAVLAGHLHRPFVYEPGHGLPPEIVAGSALSSRHRGHGNSYNLVDVGDRGVAVTVRQRSGDAWHDVPMARLGADRSDVASSRWAEAHW